MPDSPKGVYVVSKGKHMAYRNALMYLIKLIQPLILTVLFYFICVYRQWTDSSMMLENILIPIMFFGIMLVFQKIYGAFQFGLSRVAELIYSQEIALLLTSVIFYFIGWLYLKFPPNLLSFLGMLLGETVWTVGYYFAANRLYYRIYTAKKTAVVYENRSSLESVEQVYHSAKQFDVTKTIDAENMAEEDLYASLTDVDAVFLCGISAERQNTILKHCIDRGIEVYLRPKIGDVLLKGSKRIHMFHVLILHCGRSNPPISYRFFKRAFDIVASLCAILLASPILLSVALCVYLYDRGPVLYRQKRLTIDGKVFEILKFRSMRVDAEKEGIARLATANDDRITPVGRVIRAIRFDELPQLFNILKGDMTIVGPRPERPEIAEQYESLFPEFRLRLQVKAGLTGYAQVFGKYNTKAYDKLQMDLMYIANQSIVEDIKLMFLTVKILFMPESTEGFEDGHIVDHVRETPELHEEKK